jgi:hypothetical protein
LQLARGKDELILAGIEVYKTPVGAVFRKFGKPTEQEQLYPASGDFVGQHLYVWKKIKSEAVEEANTEPMRECASTRSGVSGCGGEDYATTAPAPDTETSPDS